MRKRESHQCKKCKKIKDEMQRRSSCGIQQFRVNHIPYPTVVNLSDIDVKEEVLFRLF